MRALVVVVAFMAVAVLFYGRASGTDPAPPAGPRTDFSLGQWYCCLLDERPIEAGDPTEVGGFGGQSGRPVIE